ncbi:DUF2164 domain-containing protein [Xylanibacillus composti]|uniref:DUF2164 domain-containing protein n=1 Tax=Xylanibacillus composti TaxID=1572762 RepID=A0A8J4GZV6_9BACL|nr:DUF2164 domain-containing protein [Xylanibacillus composti]MDT9724207.1 DUF2164 domain-containing protein [Xylanibacillus composti]GIQ68278.1 hypothetical protein XYCOK13_11020 [Xylanibacillus composti]
MLMMKVSREQKEAWIREVQHYFEEERGEEIGALAAEALLDKMLALVGPAVYNHALSDVRGMLGERWAAIDDELYVMEKRQG